jgi:hypothetical protein
VLIDLVLQKSKAYRHIFFNYPLLHKLSMRASYACEVWEQQMSFDGKASFPLSLQLGRFSSISLPVEAYTNVVVDIHEITGIDVYKM